MLLLFFVFVVGWRLIVAVDWRGCVLLVGTKCGCVLLCVVVGGVVAGWCCWCGVLLMRLLLFVV